MVKIYKSYKTKLDPTRNQREYLEQCARVRRTVFNWVLGDYMRDYREWHVRVSVAKEMGLWPSNERFGKGEFAALLAKLREAGIDIGNKPGSDKFGRKKKLNAEKKLNEKLAWIMEYPYIILQCAVDDFGFAMDSYLRHRKNGDVSRKIAERKDSVGYKRRIAKMIDKGRVGEQLDPYFPMFKRRGDDQSFRLLGDGTFTVENKRIRLPKIGWVRLAEAGYIPVEAAKFISATVSRTGENWYVSVATEQEVEQPELNEITLGVSLGAANLATTSTGYMADNPRALLAYQNKRARLQRELSRRTHLTKDGRLIRGANWKKTKAKLAKLERKVADVRAHAQHDISKHIADTHPSAIIISDISASSILQSSIRQIANRIADASLGSLAERIRYKSEWNGTAVRREIPRDLCSSCGSESTKVSDGQVRCLECGNVMSAGMNRAINLSREEVKDEKQAV